MMPVEITLKISEEKKKQKNSQEEQLAKVTP